MILALQQSRADHFASHWPGIDCDIAHSPTRTGNLCWRKPMRKPPITTSLLGGAVGLAIASSAAAQAAGDPKRSSELPPGLSKVLLKEVPGIMRAILATEGSNSRLQDSPVSP